MLCCVYLISSSCRWERSARALTWRRCRGKSTAWRLRKIIVIKIYSGIIKFKRVINLYEVSLLFSRVKCITAVFQCFPALFFCIISTFSACATFVSFPPLFPPAAMRPFYDWKVSIRESRDFLNVCSLKWTSDDDDGDAGKFEVSLIKF